MTYKENITAILECYFTGFKKEIINNACNRILEQQPCEDAISRAEAIKHIENIMPYVGENIKNSLDMAIKALEQQDRIIEILDDCDLEAWEILERIKEEVGA